VDIDQNNKARTDIFMLDSSLLFQNQLSLSHLPYLFKYWRNYIRWISFLIW